MREYKGTKIIGIDHGYGNTKTASALTPSSVIAYDSRPAFSDNLLEYGGKFYRIGEGHKTFVENKATDTDFYLLSLAAAARELHANGLHSAKVYLAAGIPIKWVQRQREEFKNYLLQNRIADYVYQGKTYHVEFVGCSVFPQGYPAILDKLSDFRGNHLLVDIGSGTINAMKIVNRKVQESQCQTVKEGVSQCVFACQNALAERFAVRVDYGTIDEFLRHGAFNMDKRYAACIEDTARQYTAHIMETLAQFGYEQGLLHLTFVGGGALLMKRYADLPPEQADTITDLCAAAKGYETLALQKAKRGEIIHD